MSSAHCFVETTLSEDCGLTPEEITIMEEKAPCPHHNRGSLAKCPICGKFVCCGRCHAESGHRHRCDEVITMKCRSCGCIQDFAASCKRCERPMGDYHCGVCKINEFCPKGLYMRHNHTTGNCEYFFVKVEEEKERKEEEVEEVKEVKAPAYVCRFCEKGDEGEQESAPLHVCHFCKKDDKDEKLFHIGCCDCCIVHRSCCAKYCVSEFETFGRIPTCPICSKSYIKDGEMEKLVMRKTAGTRTDKRGAIVDCVDCGEMSITRYCGKYARCLFCQGYNTKFVAYEE